ncbi:MAG: phosphate ABC transporter, permease protein PstA [Candidatus Cloacimonadota bacterium]|nr:MAG: phosphate ABC transporter, permease protein PstA [Candidatus Cloacimonadota bacterium]PIE77712.1 MAG: phosphate ABC transporter, permease protein PstA [Candidatus Delongbacteria bacterium]
MKTFTSRRVFIDKFVKFIIVLLSGISIVPLLIILYQLIDRGIKQINLSFFTQNAPDTLEAMEAISRNEIIPGGIANGITGSFMIVGMAALIAIPLGVLVGIYLSESKKSKFAMIVKFMVDLLQGVPSIVLGILGYIWIVTPVTRGFSALAGSMSLSIMMLPSIVKSTEETLNMIPETLKEAALSLGVPYYKAMFKVILPTGISGIITGIMLGISRIIGETAPLLLTTLGSSAINFNPTKPTSSIPTLIWEFYNDPNLMDMIWSASLFLVSVVFILNLIAKGVSKIWKVQF